jgi:hypothetical protein
MLWKERINLLFLEPSYVTHAPVLAVLHFTVVADAPTMCDGPFCVDRARTGIYVINVRDRESNVAGSQSRPAIKCGVLAVYLGQNNAGSLPGIEGWVGGNGPETEHLFSVID